MGRNPAPFDLLYWNADATNMPAAAHIWVMRNLYLENRLRQQGGLSIAGEYTGNLSNGGEILKLDSSDGTIFEIEFS